MRVVAKLIKASTTLASRVVAAIILFSAFCYCNKLKMRARQFLKRELWRLSVLWLLSLPVFLRLGCFQRDACMLWWMMRSEGSVLMSFKNHLIHHQSRSIVHPSSLLITSCGGGGVGHHEKVHFIYCWRDRTGRVGRECLNRLIKAQEDQQWYRDWDPAHHSLERNTTHFYAVVFGLIVTGRRRY